LQPLAMQPCRNCNLVPHKYMKNKVFSSLVRNLDKDTLNLYTLPCIELGIATTRRLSRPF